MIRHITTVSASFLLVLAFGIIIKQVVSDLVRIFDTLKTYQIKQKKVLLGIKGEIESIDGVTITLKTDKEIFILSISESSKHTR